MILVQEILKPLVTYNQFEGTDRILWKCHKTDFYALTHGQDGQASDVPSVCVGWPGSHGAWSHLLPYKLRCEPCDARHPDSSRLKIHERWCGVHNTFPGLVFPIIVIVVIIIYYNYWDFFPYHCYWLNLSFLLLLFSYFWSFFCFFPIIIIELFLVVFALFQLSFPVIIIVIAFFYYFLVIIVFFFTFIYYYCYWLIFCHSCLIFPTSTTSESFLDLSVCIVYLYRVMLVYFSFWPFILVLVLVYGRV